MLTEVQKVQRKWAGEWGKMAIKSIGAATQFPAGQLEGSAACRSLAGVFEASATSQAKMAATNAFAAYPELRGA